MIFQVPFLAIHGVLELVRVRIYYAGQVAMGEDLPGLASVKLLDHGFPFSRCLFRRRMHMQPSSDQDLCRAVGVRRQAPRCLVHPRDIEFARR